MYRVFGDIEDKPKLFQTVMDNLSATKYDRRCIYLGDIYTAHHSTLCISQIEQILIKHNIEIVDLFNNDNIHDHNFLKQNWQQMYNDKHIDIYNMNYIQYFAHSPTIYPTDSGHILTRSHQRQTLQPTQPQITKPKRSNNNKFKSKNKFSILADNHQPQPLQSVINNLPIDYNQSLGSLNNSTSPIFIFGNKDVGFVLQMLKHIKIVTTDEHSLIVTYHSFRHYDNGKLCTNIYTSHELNVMWTFISNCRHYYIDNNILYVHCFLNGRKLDPFVQFNKIVCGHHKGFGMLTSSEYNNKYIFMIDYTVIDNDMLIPSKVYFDVNKSRITMVDDRFFPTTARNCNLVSISEKMVNDPNDDGTNNFKPRKTFTEMLNGEVVIKHPFGNLYIPKFHQMNKVRHLNRHTLRHDCYSDSELIIEHNNDDFKHYNEV